MAWPPVIHQDVQDQVDLLRSAVVNVRDRGVKGDAKRFTAGATTTAGSATLTVSGTTLTSADIGKAVYVVGAGASGVTLATTITAVPTGTTATLGTTAGTAVTNAAWIYGTDDTTAMQAIFEGSSDTTYHDIFMPKGNYLMGPIFPKNNTRITGSGHGGWAFQFFDRTTRIIAKPGTTGALISDYGGSAVGNVTIKDIMLDGAKAFSSTTLDGIKLVDSGQSGDPMWLIQNVLVYQFTGKGIYIGALRRACRVNNSHVLQCNGIGVHIAGSDNQLFQTVSAQNGGDGVYIEQSAAHVIGCDIFTNGGRGITLAPFGRMALLMNNSLDDNFQEGIYTQAKNTMIIGCKFSSNSKSADGTYADIEINGGVTGCSVIGSAHYSTYPNGVGNLSHSAIRAPSNVGNAANGVMVMGLSWDPSVTTFRSGTVYDEAQVSLLHKGFSMADGANIPLGTTTGTKFGTASTQKMGFYGATPVVRPSVTGSRGGNAALASLLTQLAALGLVADSTSA
jgi:hypothetical protein